MKRIKLPFPYTISNTLVRKMYLNACMYTCMTNGMYGRADTRLGGPTTQGVGQHGLRKWSSQVVIKK